MVRGLIVNISHTFINRDLKFWQVVEFVVSLIPLAQSSVNVRQLMNNFSFTQWFISKILIALCLDIV